MEKFGHKIAVRFETKEQVDTFNKWREYFNWSTYPEGRESFCIGMIDKHSGWGEETYWIREGYTVISYEEWERTYNSTTLTNYAIC